MIWTKEKHDPIAQRLEELGRLEQERLGKESSGLERAVPGSQKISEKIPDGLRNTLSFAFCKAFSLLFSKGSAIISRSYDVGKLHQKFSELDAKIDEGRAPRDLRHFSRNAGRGNRVVQVASGVSGTGMGLLGIGLPDIPILIATLLRTVYQTAGRCGYGVEGVSEQLFVLRLIRNAVQSGERQLLHHKQLLLLGEKIDTGTRFTGSLSEELRRTADTLADAVLIAKFVQGLPLVGVVGGVSNFLLVGQVADYSALVYEKRYLLKKQHELSTATPQRPRLLAKGK